MQTRDKYIYQGNMYYLLNKKDFEPFNPLSLGFKPMPLETLCIRGYWCEYQISIEGLFLDKIYIHCSDENYPDINGKSYDVDAAGQPIDYNGYRVYSNLVLRMMNNGKILIGKDLIAKRGSGESHLPYGSKTLRELMFERGKLTHTVNWDEEIENIREARQNIEKMKEYKKNYWWLEK